MPTGYTQQIINGNVKTPKEFLHLCLRNFGICNSMRDMPFDKQQEDYTEHIKKFALNQIDISKEFDDYKDELSKEIITKEEFISNHMDEYEKEFLQKVEWDINYHQEQITTITKNMNGALAFYEHFKKEIDKL